MKKNLSVICVFFFLLIALSSSRYTETGSYYKKDMVEDKSDTRNYYVKNNGEKVFCGKVEFDSRMLRKDVVEVDGQELKTSEVLGYRFEDKYFGRFGNGSYAQRIIHGKINLYYREMDSPNTGYRVIYYSQVGEQAPLVAMEDSEDVLNLVNGCQTAMDLMKRKKRDIKRGFKEDPRYFNTIFDIYNNNCKREKVIY